MSNTATINSPDGITISRIKPTILSEHMSDIQWNAFCEDVDRALAPARELKKLSNWYDMISISSCLFFSVVVVLSVLSLLSGSLIFFIALIVIEFAAICYTSKRFQAPSAQLMNGLNEVCNRYSTSIPDVEFKVIDNRDSEDRFKGLRFKVWGDNQRDYIEVTVTSTSGSNVETPMAIATTTINTSSPSEPPIVKAFAVTEPSAPTTNDLEMGNLSINKTSITSRREQRMAELDAMKDRISEDEYYAKRAEILSDI